MECSPRKRALPQVERRMPRHLAKPASTNVRRGGSIVLARKAVARAWLQDEMRRAQPRLRSPA
eukprot:1126338-Alexandrium_andersonii.AAC.1